MRLGSVLERSVVDRDSRPSGRSTSTGSGSSLRRTYLRKQVEPRSWNSCTNLLYGGLTQWTPVPVSRLDFRLLRPQGRKVGSTDGASFVFPDSGASQTRPRRSDPRRFPDETRRTLRVPDVLWEESCFYSGCITDSVPWVGT